MVFKLVEINELSGTRTQILSVVFFNGEDWEEDSLFDYFILECDKDYPIEVEDIYTRLETIGKKTGLRRDHFKDKEGKPGDGLIALFDLPNKSLRLYGISFGSIAIILGNGGPKPKSIRALQESEKLNAENATMRAISTIITKAIFIERRLKITEYGIVPTDDHDDLVFTDED